MSKKNIPPIVFIIALGIFLILYWRFDNMTKINAFLLIGQSNMSGRGDIDKVPVLSNSNILMFRQGKWIPAVEPLHTDKEWAGVGMGMAFAVELAEKFPESRIGLIPCAFGGSPLSRWVPGGDLYENAIAITKQAMEQSVLKGILWHQGESDSGNKDDADTYGQRFASMITGMRKELSADDVPVITGELGEFLEGQENIAFFKNVNDTLHNLKETIPLYGCVSSAGLIDKGDAVHFDALSLREFGKRYAKEYMAIMRNGIE